MWRWTVGVHGGDAICARISAATARIVVLCATRSALAGQRRLQGVAGIY
jgi:hypothetical protein